MTTLEFLSLLRSKKIKLWVEGDKLRYHAPTGELTPELLAEMAERKADILEFLRNASNDTAPILPVLRNQNLPLSFAQERLWFLDQLDVEHTSYNIPFAIRLTGSINVPALEMSISEIIRRHEILRTSYTTVDGQPVQVINPPDPFKLMSIDLQKISEEDRVDEARRLANEDACRPFDLTKSQMLRAILLRLDHHDHVLFFNIHHIAFDSWSTEIILQELDVFYDAFVTGKPIGLPEPPVQYVDYALWQKDRLSDKAMEAQLAYWKQKLSGSLAILELPTDRARPSIQTFRGAAQSHLLSEELSRSLRDLCRHEEVTLFMTMLAAFQLLLSRLSAQEDVVVGSPIANRNKAEIKGLIGFFLNTLVFRTNLSKNLTFRELLHRVQEVALEAYMNQDFPFEKLVEELQPRRDLSHNPLFQVMFVLEESTETIHSLAGLATTPFIIEHNNTTKFDLTLFVNVTDKGLLTQWEYSTDLFDDSTIRRFAGHYQTLLENVVVNPDLPIAEVPIMSSEERQQLIIDWNDTTTESLPESLVQDLFERQVERTPDAVALVGVPADSDQINQLTYTELNNKANQLAHYLKRLGVGPDVLVGVSMGRSLEMGISILAVLKAGGAYVPLDPAYPMERLAFMIEDSQILVLLTQEKIADKLPKCNAKILRVDTMGEVLEEESKTNLPLETKPSNLVYVIYTSGSTGKPKGVAMVHRATSNLIPWQIKHSNLSTEARTLQFSSYSFDVSFQEFFATWCSGGTLLLISEELRRDADRLLHYLEEARVERLFLPFIALQNLAEMTDFRGLGATALREIITAGEQLQVTKHIKNLFELLGNCTLTNQYGPTESHVVTSYTLKGEPSNWTALPPIGRPIDNTQIYLLNKNLEPVPIGVVGELYIGGVNLARGYLNRPQLTNEKFVPDPFSEAVGSRLYRTGDLARYLPDGNIEFLGRADDQVKIRGFRIELGEIEAILGQHPSIRENVVSSFEDDTGTNKLVAHVSLNTNEMLSVSELRRFLSQKLPEYMVPSIVIFLDDLPLLPSGKVNRRTLPIPNANRPDLEAAFVAPRNSIEWQIALIWQEVLNLEKVGVNDNFFELGGHSLSLTQVVARMQQAFQLEIPLRTIFKNTTVAAQAQSVEKIFADSQFAVGERADNKTDREFLEL